MKCISCDNLAVFGFNEPTHCFDHKDENMKLNINYDTIDGYSMKKKSGFCISNDCEKRASFNFEGECALLFCGPHKLEGMICVAIKKCLFQDCNIRPSFNNPNETKGLYCNSHKLDGMINVSAKKCAHVGCFKQPCFNYKGEKTGIYCATHKKDKMVDVINTNCLIDECKKKPNYNYQDQTKGSYCKEHKLDGMINVISKKCVYEGCITRPSYNYPDQSKGLYCNTHKLEGMINVKDKKCIYKDCKKIPFYNDKEENKPLYCSIHKSPEMINVRSTKCIVDGCEKWPYYNNKNDLFGLYCNEHKLSGMINIKSPRCKTMGCDTFAQVKRYQGYCFYCFINTFPDNEIVRNIKVKEREFIDPIKVIYNDRFSYDRIINGGCSLRRPDAFCDCLTHTLTIEIDELGHRDYDILCEFVRTNEIFTDCGDRPQVNLRINPDICRDENNKKKNCFKLHKSTGVLMIDDKAELKKRIDKMLERIDYWMNNIPPEGLTVEKLFY